jgi:peroxiredoxin
LGSPAALADPNAQTRSGHERCLTCATTRRDLDFNSHARKRESDTQKISTDPHHTLQEFRASVGAQWTFLSDAERIIQNDLDIREYTDPENDPMIPHTLVLKPGLIIHSIYNGYWFWGRPSVEDLRHDLRAVTSEIRPDWDLSAPELRDAWNAGKLAPFHGWDQSAPASPTA